ncbi:MAG: peptidoglycan-binding protein [Rhodobacteraceae bacterium GWE1_64_9]|nr:MAG: peptidoglycan-binding protein [Rhodobacteraceae bacterium GWE1_64_9]OHC48823.1 MAG: peptidoglycan-binding protein [Rhodobacteraceae bacterium GWF1_65_7]HBD90436.1 peptidoglycan-binding protein [Gemmobacter sp.]HBU16074.1 peptidoglycan-binding protein [Gemmobacter sp.]
MARSLAIAAVLVLAGCQPGPRPEAPATADLKTEIRRAATPDAPPPAGGPGECWATDVTPAVIETVSEQVVVTPERRDATGRVISPASYRSDTHQRIVRDRTAVHFRTPCPAEMTLEFVATLQRALKARGYYLAPVSGVLDAPTRDAIRRFQEPLGLDSPVLSLAAARALGLVTTDLKDL